MDIPSRVGKYRVLAKLGEGASGCVLKVEQDTIKRCVALKLLLTRLLHERPNIVDRFKREARLAASLVHSSIVPIFDIGEDQGMYYYTMQYVDGTPMMQTVGNPDLSLDWKVNIFLKLTDALALAHSRDIIHRDLKPHNVIIDKNNQPIILDFGIAKSLIEDVHLTQNGHILGSAHYMAPEQAGRGQVDTRTDVFALGVMMYELFSGQRPFKGDTIRDLIISRIEYRESPEKHQLPSLTMLCPAIPPALETIVFKCLHADPDQRYTSAGNLLAALQQYQQRKLAQCAVKSLSVSARKSIIRSVNRRTSYVYPVLCALFILFVGLLTIGLIELHYLKFPELGKFFGK